MDAALKQGATVRLDGLSGSFEVLGVHGRGGSCVVYRTRYTDAVGNKIYYLLKEFNPQSLAMERNETGDLVCPEKKRESFQKGFERFKQGYGVQETIRQISGLSNSTAQSYGIYSGYGTCYILTQLFEGGTYAEIQDESLVSTLTTIRSLAKVIGKYHRDGYLHLDIKPANILVLPETREHIILFDFDSVIRKDQARETAFLSYTQNWAAPEQIVPSMHRNICEATDLFAIGEILFTKLMGRHSTDRERRPSCAYQELRERPKLKGVDERVIRGLADLFHNTLCSSVKRRWQSAQELLNALENLLELAKQKHVLCSSNIAPKSFFIGRDAELRQIHEKLNQYRVLFLTGMGGIGKSELAKNYAKTYNRDYDTQVFAFYSGSLLTTMTDDSYVSISEFGQIKDESTEEYFERKLGKLRELCAAQNTLLILDNMDQDEFDTDEARRWRMILELPCTLLVTSRCSGWEREQLSVQNLSDETGMELFRKHYQHPLSQSQETAAGELLTVLGNHTMAVEMAAKQLYASAEFPSELLERLKASTLSKMGKEKVRGEKDNLTRNAPAYEHILALFCVSNLDAEAQKVLLNMALVHPKGITRRTFKMWCGLSSLDSVNKLCSSGWLIENGQGISMHPLVSEVVLDSTTENRSVCDEFLGKFGRYLTENLSQMDFEIRQRRRNQGLWTASRLSRYEFFSTAVCNFYTGLGRLLQSLHDISQNMQYSKKALDLAERLYEANDAKLVVPYNNYGAALEFAGDRAGKAIYYKKAFDILKALGEGSNSLYSQGVVLSNLADEFKQLGQFEEAETYYKKALDILVVQGQDENTAVVHRNLGKFYMDIGKLPAAHNHLQNALRIQLDGKREHSYHTIDIYSSLGAYYRLTGKYEEARDALTHAVDVTKELIGEENEKIANLYHHLGLLDFDAGNYDVALSYIRYAEEIFSKVLPEKNEQILTVQNSIAMILLKQEKFDAAKQLYQKICERWQEKYPDEDNEHIAHVFLNLSLAYRGMGDFPLAEEYARKGLGILIDRYGEQHQKVATAYSSLGETQRMTGKLDEAVTSLKKALAIRQGLFGEQHPAVGLSHNRLAKAYQDQGDCNAAAEQYISAFESYKRDLPKVKPLLDELISVLKFLGRNEEADLYHSYL